MRPDITVGTAFPDYGLPDHTGTPRRLSEIQSGEPMITVLPAKPIPRRTSGSTRDWHGCGGR
jgi:hypothetical protein